MFKDKAADAIDMETAGFYQTCKDFNVACLCIRSFNNPVTNAQIEDLHAEQRAVVNVPLRI
ncbi:phosphorylase family protein [Coxiella endosymbiont of Ornithodoros maritimus]|uniref:phosphorylase family protein n=1 Tax=Coxiella endosymbiont of Ornithodoros maritimus TaxID=1656172 RepID=UPI002265444C|nr:hypothetical protein [Coxiella endosymbiont of Ornithodoros maritimus]